MTISIWRYSHLAMAISSSLFILLAAITGIILAFEPITKQLTASSSSNLEQQTLSSTIAVLTSKYDEVISFKIDDNNIVEASLVTKSGTSQTAHVNPFTGEQVATATRTNKVYRWATTLHRSLFLKSTGRFLVGFFSFLLTLIALTGVVLILKRQGGVQQFFGKVVKENVAQYYHITLGRFTFIPILIITITGVYLSLEKFSLLPNTAIKHGYNFDTAASNQKIAATDIPVFQTTHLDQVKILEFPFSDDKEDYFFLKTKQKEYLIDQYTGALISNQDIPWVARLSHWSLLLHTGRGSLLWPFILILSCLSILYFMYSGFYMSVQRKKYDRLTKNRYRKDSAAFVILIGSETGSTNLFGNALYKTLLHAGKKVYIEHLNAYDTYKNIEHLIILTATYGDGDPPANASKFIEKLQQKKQKGTVDYSVVGFGSLAYAHYCQFAIDIDAALQQLPNFKSRVPLFKINNQSFNDFKSWGLQFSNASGIELHLKQTIRKIKNQQKFALTHKTAINKDDTYLIRLKPSKKTTFTSGDLLAIRPNEDPAERLYSIGKIDNDIVLSIKKHEFGICSNALFGLKKGAQLTAEIKANKAFHLPKKKPAILIANGTGIAPFLGMTQQNTSQIHLFFGIRTQDSFKLYQPYLENMKNENLHIAYSQEQQTYVQDLIAKEVDLIADTLKNEGTIMICGSVHMMKSVLLAIEKITLQVLNRPLNTFEKTKQIKTDCY